MPTVSTTYAASTQPTWAARSWPKPHSSPARNPARNASPTPVGSTAVTPGAALTSIGSASRAEDADAVGAERRHLGADPVEDLLGRPAGLGLDHVRLVLVGEQVRRAVDQVADQVAVAERELLARVGDERVAALPALLACGGASPRGRRRRSARSRARPTCADDRRELDQPGLAHRAGVEGGELRHRRSRSCRRTARCAWCRRCARRSSRRRAARASCGSRRSPRRPRRRAPGAGPAAPARSTCSGPLPRAGSRGRRPGTTPRACRAARRRGSP